MLIDSRVYLLRINLHGLHNNVAPSVIIPFSKSSSQVEVDIRDIFHCDGLLLCTTKDNRLVVWNPCSGETKWIKPRKSYKESDFYALGYHNKSSCKQYKVLRLDHHDGNNNEYEIYDFPSNSWSVLGVTTDWHLIPRTGGVSLKGNTYWLAVDMFNHDVVTYPYVLQSFDFTTERFQSLSLPLVVPYMFITDISVDREEQLFLLGYCKKYPFSWDLHVWMATSTGTDMSWSNLVTAQAFNEILIYRSKGISFLADKQHKVVVFCERYWNLNNTIYFAGENKHVQVDYHGGDSTLRSSCSLLLNYVPSLAQIQQGTVLPPRT